MGRTDDGRMDRWMGYGSLKAEDTLKAFLPDFTHESQLAHQSALVGEMGSVY